MAKILIVEDDIDNQNVLSTMLELAGHTSKIAGNGREAIVLAEQVRPDVIFMDIALPVMDGWEVIDVLTKHATLGSTPIIAITAYATTEDARHAFELGCRDYIAKPVDYYILIEKLNSVLDGVSTT